jgi:hypothetical protein
MGGNLIELIVTPEQALKAIQKIKDEFVPIFGYALANQMAFRMLALMQQFTPVGQYPSGSGRAGGNLRSSEDVDEVQGGFWVGTHSVNYAKYVALGTIFMKPRPFHTLAYERVSQEAPTMALALLAKYADRWGGEPA